ncbi:hypothetical protein FQN57_004620 [Myotisia sp. PD_48]|nr:hypothetical protein FQN57_004620 [Myotisia sp. PD_48]
MKIPNRNQASAQNFISGVVLFFTVGVYLAVLGLGAGGGKPSSQDYDDSYDRTGGQAFPIVAGCILGLSAPMLWSVSGFIQWAYATEAEKGKYISVQYFINQVGSVVGSLVALGIILKGGASAEGSPTPVYIAFIVLMCVAFFVVGFGLVKPSQVVRADGTHLAVFRQLTYKEEFAGIARVVRDWRVLVMLPVIFSSEMPLSIMPALNAHYFDLRTRAMNNVIFYAVALPGSVLVTYLTDMLPFSRRKRGLIALSVLAVIDIGGWIAALAWVSISDTYKNPPQGGVSWSDANFAGPFVIYVVFGVLYTCHQLIGMWVMGTFTNDPRNLAVYGGIWKGVAGGGLAVSFGMNSAGVSHQSQLIMMFIFQFISFPIMFTLIGFFSSETNYGKEVGVIVPKYAEEQYNAQTVLGTEETQSEKPEQVEDSESKVSEVSQKV